MAIQILGQCQESDLNRFSQLCPLAVSPKHNTIIHGVSSPKPKPLCRPTPPASGDTLQPCQDRPLQHLPTLAGLICFGCHQCNFHVHRACAGYFGETETISFFAHPSHALKLSRSPGRVCDICRGDWTCLVFSLESYRTDLTDN